MNVLTNEISLLIFNLCSATDFYKRITRERIARLLH
jgi:hypothetical protein